MNEDLKKARSVFWSALEIPSPQKRREYLTEASGDDAALRQKVEQLLKAHEDAGSFLETPLLEANPAGAPESASAAPRDSDERAGSWATNVPLSSGLSLDFLQPSDKSDCLGRFGPYDIHELVGRGGMGVVLRGQDRKLNRVVAIKVVAPQLASNATVQWRFHREAQAAAAVSHPHLVTIHAVAEAENLPYLVMEYVDGISLAERIERDGPLELQEILRIGAQVASGLAAAHHQGLVHRDVKPANILLENSVQRVKLTDFGLARAVDDVNVTQAGEVTGTPQYMSPEQAQDQKLDHRSDLFSLGCVLYAMCTGRSPFRAETSVAALRRVCDDAPRPIRETNSDGPFVTEPIQINHRLRIRAADDYAPMIRLSPKAAEADSGEETETMLSAMKSPRRWLMLLPLVLALLAGGMFVFSGSTLADPPDHANPGSGGGGHDDDGGVGPTFQCAIPK